MPILPTMFNLAGPNGAREELLAPRAGCEAVELMEATAMGSTLGPGPKDALVPSTGLPRSWFSVSGWGWFTWNGLIGPEATAAPVFFEVRRLSNSEKSSLTVPFKLLKRSKAPEAAAGLAAEAAAQESELVELECVLVLGGTPHRSTEEAGLAPHGQGFEVLAGAAGPPQGLVWLAEADRPQGSACWAAGPELGRASIKSNRVVCCG